MEKSKNWIWTIKAMLQRLDNSAITVSDHGKNLF
jgi:hypothetical protein